MTKIAVFVGSLREKSHNLSLAKALEAAAPEGFEFDYIDINVQLFNEDVEANYPEDIKAIKERVRAADGLLFATPEYNRSIPGVLKNAIDWYSRPYGDSAFAGKRGGIVGAGASHVATAIAQSDLRHIMAFLDVATLGQPELYVAESYLHFSESGEPDEDTARRAKEYMDVYAKWVKA